MLKVASVLLALVLSVAAETVDVSKGTSFNSLVKPGKYIIEVAHASDLPNVKRGNAHAAVYDALAKRGIGFRVHREFKQEGLFVGASVELQRESDYGAMEATPGITGIYPVHIFPAPKPIKQVLGKTKGGSTNATSTVSQTLIDTGVDKLHKLGLRGSGVKIGVIDSGVDYRHPSLGGGFGRGKKIAGGYDFVGDDYDGYNDPIPDPDPLDTCIMHGTHVAGIIGADSNNVYGMSGVAPEASQYAYRVFGCYGSTDDSVLLDALLRAYNDGMDVITMSLGATHGWSYSVTSALADRIAQRGRIVTVAAGNIGEAGAWLASSPAGGRNVIAVASTDNTARPTQKAALSGVNRTSVVYYGLDPLPLTASSYPLYATSLNASITDDACEPLPASTPNLAGTVVLVRRGECPLYTKVANIAAKGAAAILIYNNVPGLEELTFDPTYITQLMPAADGEYLVQQLAAKKQPRIAFPQKNSYQQWADPTGGLTSVFSSYGPTYDMFMRPGIAAPGGNILSCWVDNGWAMLSGTSMATPFMAGVSALLFQKNGRSASTAASARSLFQTTSKPVPVSHDKGAGYHTIAQAGAGLIDAYAALTATTILSPGQFELNDTEHFNPVKTFTITNKSKKVKIYKIAHVPALTSLTVEADGLYADQSIPLSTTSTAASVRFSLSTVILLPGLSLPIIATFTPPRGLDANRYPVYSGWITVSADDETQRIPYLGVASALRNKQVVNNPLLLSVDGIIREPYNYTYVDNDYPFYLMRLSWGTISLRLDLVSATTNYTPHIGKRIPTKSIKTLGSMLALSYLRRNAPTQYGDDLFFTMDFPKPVFENGTRIPAGQYKFWGRGLRVFGNPENNDDYDSWLSPEIGIP